jgi:uncharacterized SAM-binding protein YcdF (DUF218 family)
MAFRGRKLRWLGVFLVVVIVFGIVTLHWGGDLLVKDDPLPAHVDAAIVLEGSMIGERARLLGAVALAQQNVAERILLPLPAEGYWGEPIPPMARHFLEANYGPELAGRVDFCIMDRDVDSTMQEAQALEGCIRERHLQSAAIVTSTYHTRRAGIIWRKVMRQDIPSLQLWVHGVNDPEFQADGWWQRRLWAKTWLMEVTKLIWTDTGGK